MGNRRTLTETIVAVLDVSRGAYLETDGLVVVEAEQGQVISHSTYTWLTATAISGYTGTSYLDARSGTEALYLSDGPQVEYAVNFTTPGSVEPDYQWRHHRVPI